MYVSSRILNILKYNTLFFVIVIINVILCLSKNSFPELDKIIEESIQENPKNLNGFLPTLPKIITKTGLICEFPFIFNKNEHFDKCMFQPNGKSYCKVSKKKNANDVLLKLENQYFDECLTLDETEQYFNSLVEESYDFKNKLLIDLFSDIRMVTTESKNEKLILIDKLAERTCKTNKFNLDCLYTSLLDPISKNSEINDSIKNKLFDVINKYKLSLNDYISNSIKEKFSKQSYLFITKDNLNLVEDDKLKEDENIINLPRFFKLMIFTGDVCVEECKSAIEYIFYENFKDNIDRIKLETVSYLFHIKNLTNVDDQLVHNSTHIKYKDHFYTINENSQNFVKYDQWNLRYFIHIIYRYLLMEKSFYKEIILGDYSNSEQQKAILGPSLKDLTENQEVKLSRIIPLISPYYKFTLQAHEKVKAVYDKWLDIGNDLEHQFKYTDESFSTFSKFLNHSRNKIVNVVKLINSTFIPELKNISLIKQKTIKINEQLASTEDMSSTYFNIKTQSYQNSLEYITQVIYKTSFFLTDCNKFLHYHSYLDINAMGKPTINYVPLGYDPVFFIDFSSDIKLFFLYGLKNFYTEVGKGEKQLDYKINILTNFEIDVFFDNVLLEPYSVKPVKSNSIYPEGIQLKFKILAPNRMNAYRKFLVKGKYVGDEKVSKKFLFYKSKEIVPKKWLPTVKSNVIRKNANSLTSEHSSANTSKDVKDIFKDVIFHKPKDECKTPLMKLNFCFNVPNYIPDCEVACKFLSEKERERLEKLEYERLSKMYYFAKGKGYDKNITKGKNFNTKFTDKISKFINICNNYCDVFKWDIYIYKCIFRHIDETDLDILITKCGGYGEWELVSRLNQNSTTWFKDSNELLGTSDVSYEREKFKLNETLLEFAIPSYFNPLGNVNFRLPFDINNIDEIMIATGDMSKWITTDKFQLLVKGNPYTGYSKLNYKVYHTKFYKSPDNHQYSSINYIDHRQKGFPFVLLNKICYNSTTKITNESDLIFAEDEVNHNMDLVKNNKGINIFTRKKNICLEQMFFTSNLPGKPFFIEPCKLSKFILVYGGLDINYMIYKLPEKFDKKAKLLKTLPYQSKYHFNIIKPSRIHLAIEINKDIEIVATKLIEDGWIFIEGSENIIEVVQSDIGDQIKLKEKLSHIECVFPNPVSPVCKEKKVETLPTIKFNIFYKDLEFSILKLNYDFWEFDNLYSCLHFLFIYPRECVLEDNHVDTTNHRVNNYVNKIRDFLPTFDGQQNLKLEKKKKKWYFHPFAQKVKKDSEKTKEKEIDKTSNKDKFLNVIKEEQEEDDENDDDNNEKKEKKDRKNSKDDRKNVVKGKERNTFSVDTGTKNSTLVSNVSSNTKLNFTSPKIMSNQNGCVLALDRFGNLFFINKLTLHEDIDLNSTDGKFVFNK